MTSRAGVILEPFGPERASRAGPLRQGSAQASTKLRAGSATGKNLGYCRALAHKAQTDLLPPVPLLCKEGRGEVEYRPPSPTQTPRIKERSKPQDSPVAATSGMVVISYRLDYFRAL